MKKSFLICLCALFLQTRGTAQHDAKARFGAVAAIAYINGGNGNAFQAQIVPGFHFNNWFAGVGAATDGYFTKSVPVFLGLRRRIPIAKSEFFVYADGGLNLVKRDSLQSTYSLSQNKNGGYADVGLGYTRPVPKTFSMNVSFGYSYKGYERIANYKDPSTGDYSNRTDRYELNRYVLRLGIGF